MGASKSITISVPGTSANLGPGFDILGMALKIYNHFQFTIREDNRFDSLLKNGEPLPFQTKDDLLMESYKKYFSLFLPDENIPGYRCKMDLGLPLKGGLGSSASAVVAGFTFAREIHKKKFSHIPIPGESLFLYKMAEMEGHPDNTSPAYLGGFVLSYFDNHGRLKYFKKKFPNSVAVFILSPCIQTSTSESRKTLPDQYSTEDMIFNMTRIATWMQFFQTKKFSDLRLALEDRIHTPYRIQSLPFIPDMVEMIERKKMGYCLSGSGPTILVFLERKRVSQIIGNFSEELSRIMEKQGIEYNFQRVKTDNLGVRIN